MGAEDMWQILPWGEDPLRIKELSIEDTFRKQLYSFGG